MEKFEILESFRFNQVWPKLVNKVCSLGPEKSLKQCTMKMQNLKYAYKKCKDENRVGTKDVLMRFMKNLVEC